ncbi:MAG: valine--tRNA ligase [Phycisphaeraceae bacterium]|nr:valine--tRNA ligase [Phycisphaeraceae bacterium]
MNQSQSTDITPEPAAGGAIAGELSRQYQPVEIEPEMRRRWVEQGVFHASPTDAGEPYAVMIPPPNVTAALHMGHALNNTIQDVLVRWRRMRGFNTLWMPGTDHAGIATQTVVEKRVLHEEGKRRTDFAREEFVRKIEAWKDEYEGRITDQLKAMGCSCDWDRQRFTMDPICAAAVREAFFRLFADGLIYRGKRLVNWDPATKTALADDEVENVEVDSSFWYLKYPIVDDADGDTGEFVTVATTRPETMLGDTAVAMNPKDPRAAELVGRRVRLPIVNRLIPIIADDYVVLPDADSEDAKARYASGFLKVTPAHDPNDYEIGRRQQPPLAMVNVMAPDGSISLDHGWPIDEIEGRRFDPFLDELAGKDRFEARKMIVRWFERQGLLAEIRPYRHSVGHSYRSHVPIEPYLSDQWYVKVTDDRLAGAALGALAPEQTVPGACLWRGDQEATVGKPAKWEGKLLFFPSRYARTFQHWHENIRDWCISRQLWWGHRIPVWSRLEVESSEKELLERIKASLKPWIDDVHIRIESRTSEGDARSSRGEDERSVCDVFIAVRCDEPELLGKLTELGMEQDPDVLDTWFSSGLWPISTLGWPDPEKFPDEIPEGHALLERFNPGSSLCTAREIITLWVSRMVMFNIYFRGCLPFEHVFIHAMIQDGEGQKMSKSLGNGVDPLDIIHRHGSDAMRFTLTQMTTQTQDVRMPVDMVCPHTGQVFTPKMISLANGIKVAAPIQESPGKPGAKMVSSYGIASGKARPDEQTPAARNTSSKFDYGRNFANKLWNAVRFALGRLESARTGAGEPASTGFEKLGPADRWILGRLMATMDGANRALEEYQFNTYAQLLYDFTWGDLCDWYIEAIKPTMDEKPEQQAVLAACLDVTLRLLHPVMPFITEALWEKLRAVVPERSIPGLALPDSLLLACAPWPTPNPELDNDEAQKAFSLVREIVGAIRQVRTEYKVPPRKVVTVSAQATAAQASRMLQVQQLVEILAAAHCKDVGPRVDRPADAAVAATGGMQIFVHGLVDREAEQARLTKALEESRKNVATLEARLANEGYVKRAPPHLVEQTREQLDTARNRLHVIENQLARLG